MAPIGRPLASTAAVLVACLLLLQCALGFTSVGHSSFLATTATSKTPRSATTSATSSLHLSPSFTVLDTVDTSIMSSSSSSSSLLHAAAPTVDPTAILSNSLGGFLGSPAVLAIPIVAALGLASLIAFLIYSYAQPAVDDDEY